MKLLLGAHTDIVLEQGDMDDPEYRAKLARWCREFMGGSDKLWAAMAKVLSAAIQLDLETPSWCRCRPGGDELSNAIDLVIEALPPNGQRAFDKQQGA